MEEGFAVSTNPQEFFRSELKNAFLQQRLNVCEEVEFYIVNLLSSFVFKSPQTFERPLALKFKDAIEAPSNIRPKLFKNLGDSSLYQAGFFQDSFNRKIFDVDYFISMGETAYSHLSLEIKKRSTKDNNASQTYDKLSIMFGDLVESLATLSDKFNLNKTANLLSNYERWEATGSKRLLNKMLEDGIIPTNDTLKKVQ